MKCQARCLRYYAYSLLSLLQTLIYKWKTRCQPSYFLTEERIFTSLTRNTLPCTRGQWFFQSNHRERANTPWHTENHEPKGAGAAGGAQTYLEKETVPLVLSVDGAEPVLVLRGDVDLVAREGVTHLAELLDLGLENFLQALVFQFCTFHLLLQLWVKGRKRALSYMSPSQSPPCAVLTVLPKLSELKRLIKKWIKQAEWRNKQAGCLSSWPQQTKR